MSDAKTLEDFPVGLKKSVETVITTEMVYAFVRLSGDDNPLHIDPKVAQAAGFRAPVVHGCLTLAFVSKLIGTALPGPGALWRSLQVDWLKPLYPGDRLILTGEVEQRSESTESIMIRIDGRNQIGTAVLRARAWVGLLRPAGAETATMVAEPVRAEKSTQNLVAQLPQGTARPVLVTGESLGIARAIALELGRRGYPVAVGYLTGEREANQSVREIVEGGGRAVAVPFDFSSQDQLLNAFRATEVALGPVLAVVHAAALPLDSTAVAQLEDHTLDLYWRVYVKGALALCRAILPAVRNAHWGRFIFLGSAALIGVPPDGMTAYLTAKSAALGMMKSLAVELGPLGLTVNTVSPGLTADDLMGDYSPRVQMAEAQRNPVRRLARAADTAYLVRFLMSDEASFINGSHLPVTGGSSMI